MEIDQRRLLLSIGHRPPNGAMDMFDEQVKWMEEKLAYARENDATHIFGKCQKRLIHYSVIYIYMCLTSSFSFSIWALSLVLEA